MGDKMAMSDGEHILHLARLLNDKHLALSRAEAALVEADGMYSQIIGAYLKHPNLMSRAMAYRAARKAHSARGQDALP